MKRTTSETGRQSQDMMPTQTVVAIGSLAGALAACSCCMLPLLLFTVGASGAWIGTLVQLAPLQPYFLAVATLSLACGYWSVYRSGRIAGADWQSCRPSAAAKLVKTALVVSTALVALAIGFNFLMPLLNS